MLQQALDALIQWDKLIGYQYIGSKEAMRAILDACDYGAPVIEALRAELAKQDKKSPFCNGGAGQGYSSTSGAGIEGLSSDTFRKAFAKGEYGNAKPQQDEREAFEEHVSAVWFERSRTREYDLYKALSKDRLGEYLDMDTRSHWITWQARAAKENK